MNQQLIFKIVFITNIGQCKSIALKLLKMGIGSIASSDKTNENYSGKKHLLMISYI